MKRAKLDGRYTANRRWGYNYSVTIPSWNWNDYYKAKKIAVDMFGTSHDVKRRYIFRDDQERLLTAEWAFHYEKTSKPTVIYFRNEKYMEQVLMMFALTKGA